MNCRTCFTLAAVASLVLFGCRDNTVTPPSSGPVFAVSDGAHNGNPDFFFLPPMFKNPNTSPNFEPAAFNPNLRPAVEICLLGLPAPDGTRDCVGAPVTRFSPSQISLNSTDQLYQVNWNTALSNLNLANFYRIQVLVGTRVLGFADVDPVVSLTGTQLQNLQTGEFIPLVDGRTLPIKFRIETGVLCATDGTPCNSSTINLNTGGTIELLGAGEDFKFDIRPGTSATFGGNTITDVTFNLEVCSGIDVDLPTFGPCLRVSTYFDGVGTGELAFSQPLLVSLCVLNSVYHTPDETRQEDLITLHQQDGTLIRALPHADPNCDSPIGQRGSGWSWLRSLAAQLLAPTPAYAATRSAVLHVGAGGETGSTGSSCTPPSSAPTPVPGLQMATTCPPSSPTVNGSAPQPAAAALLSPARTVSDFQFALPAKMDYLNRADADRTAPPGTALPTAVVVTDWDDHPVQGAHVTFVEPAIEGPPTIIGTATSNSDGVAQILWTIRAGPNTAVATGRGIAAQNNYPGGTVKPFMPDIDSPDPESPVALGTGRVQFTANGVAFGSLSFTQQPTNTPSGEPITPALQIQLLDPSGNPLSETVRVTVGNDPSNPAGCLVLQTSTLALEGVAVIDNVRVNGMCTGARVAATAGGGSFGFPIIFSDRFDITAPSVSLAVDFTGGTDVPLETSIPYLATVTNNGTGTLASVLVQAYIDQGVASRAAGGAVMTGCAPGSSDGVLPPGPCSINRVLVASNLTAGTGTLVAGPATGRITVVWAGVTVATVLVPITITP